MEVNDEMLIRFLLNETRVEENAMVQHWLLERPENAAQLVQLQKIWQASKNLANASAIDETQAWDAFKTKVAALPKSAPIIKPLKRIPTWLKVAAVLVLGFGVWSVYTIFGASAFIDIDPSNEVYSKILPDGSELTINKHTQLSYANNFKQNRKIRLKTGNVFFNVAHDQANPFMIAVDQVKVEVVGTSFNIKHVNQETEVVVETGIVKVQWGDQAISLVKGEKVVINSTTRQLQKMQSTDQLYNYYKTKLFVANNTPLEELVKVLNEAYNSKIVLDQEVKETFTGPLELGELTDNLKIICDVLKLKVSRNQKEILLSYQSYAR